MVLPALQVQEWILVMAAVNAVLGAAAVWLLFWSMEAEVLQGYVFGLVILGVVSFLEKRWVEGLYGSSLWSVPQIRDLVFVMVVAAFAGALTGAWLFRPGFESSSGNSEVDDYA